MSTYSYLLNGQSSSSSLSSDSIHPSFSVTASPSTSSSPSLSRSSPAPFLLELKDADNGISNRLNAIDAEFREIQLLLMAAQKPKSSLPLTGLPSSSSSSSLSSTSSSSLQTMALSNVENLRSISNYYDTNTNNHSIINRVRCEGVDCSRSQPSPSRPLSPPIKLPTTISTLTSTRTTIPTSPTIKTYSELLKSLQSRNKDLNNNYFQCEPLKVDELNEEKNKHHYDNPIDSPFLSSSIDSTLSPKTVSSHSLSHPLSSSSITSSSGPVDSIPTLKPINHNFPVSPVDSSVHNFVRSAKQYESIYHHQLSNLISHAANFAANNSSRNCMDYYHDFIRDMEVTISQLQVNLTGQLENNKQSLLQYLVQEKEERIRKIKDRSRDERENITNQLQKDLLEKQNLEIEMLKKTLDEEVTKESNNIVDNLSFQHKNIIFNLNSQHSQIAQKKFDNIREEYKIKYSTQITQLKNKFSQEFNESIIKLEESLKLSYDNQLEQEKINLENLITGEITKRKKEKELEFSRRVDEMKLQATKDKEEKLNNYIAMKEEEINSFNKSVQLEIDKEFLLEKKKLEIEYQNRFNVQSIHSKKIMSQEKMNKLKFLEEELNLQLANTLADELEEQKTHFHEEKEIFYNQYRENQVHENKKKLIELKEKFIRENQLNHENRVKEVEEFCRKQFESDKQILIQEQMNYQSNIQNEMINQQMKTKEKYMNDMRDSFKEELKQLKYEMDVKNKEELKLILNEEREKYAKDKEKVKETLTHNFNKNKQRKLNQVKDIIDFLQQEKEQQFKEKRKNNPETKQNKKQQQNQLKKEQVKDNEKVEEVVEEEEKEAGAAEILFESNDGDSESQIDRSAEYDEQDELLVFNNIQPTHLTTNISLSPHQITNQSTRTHRYRQHSRMNKDEFVSTHNDSDHSNNYIMPETNNNLSHRPSYSVNELAELTSRIQQILLNNIENTNNNRD